MAQCRRKTWCHPQNRKYITYRNDAGGGLSHDHWQHAQKLVEIALVVPEIFSRRDRQTNRQTVTQTQTILRNRSRGRSNEHRLTNTAMKRCKKHLDLHSFASLGYFCKFSSISKKFLLKILWIYTSATNMTNAGLTKLHYIKSKSHLFIIQSHP